MVMLFGMSDLEDLELLLRVVSMPAVPRLVHCSFACSSFPTTSEPGGLVHRRAADVPNGR